MKVGVNIQLAGYIQVIIQHKDGTKTEIPWFRNLITNQGLDMLGSFAGYNTLGYMPSHCAVGTGNTTPAVTDTKLVNEIAHTPVFGQATNLSSSSYVSGSPSYWSYLGTWTFAQGAVVGNIAEIGFGGPLTSGSTFVTCYARSLIKDNLGNPTTISVTSTDILTVNYEMREYINVTDTATTVTISAVVYNITVRRVAITTPPPGYAYTAVYSSGLYRSTAFTGGLAAVTASTPLGSSLGYIDGALGSYTNGNYYISCTVVAGVSNWNNGGGIPTVTIEHFKFGNWQVAFSPNIPKDNTKQLTLVWTVSWSRYP